MARNLCPTCRESKNTKGCTTIIGAAQCPNPKCGCVRSNLGCDSRVSCVLCGLVTSQVPAAFYSLPADVQEALMTLISTNGDVHRPFLTVTHVDASGKDFDFKRLHDAQGHDISLHAIDNTRVVLMNGPFESLTLTFSTEDLEAFRRATKHGRKPVATRKVPSHFPAALQDAIAKLTAFGFSYCGDGHTSFKYGDGKFAGLRATVSFYP